MNIKKLISVYYYFPVLLIFQTIILVLLYPKVESNPFVILFSGFIITNIFVFFIFRKRSTARTKYFRKYSDLLMSNEETSGLNNYEKKISDVCRVIEEMKNSCPDFIYDKEFAEILHSFKLIIDRLSDELNTAKIFKVNRNEFLGNVAHELRTPIFAIQLSLETLADGAINDADVNMDFLEKALRQSNRLKELVNDLINISRLEAGMKLSKRYFSINKLINETLNELSPIAEKKKIMLSFENKIDDETTVFADSERIKQVLINLIDNSSKYTPENGSIKISTKQNDKNVIVSVEDSGLGIPREDLPRIFERFYRVDKTRSRDMGGSGLGLSIVKHILELHNSQIKVESEMGKGTKFEFNIQT